LNVEFREPLIDKTGSGGTDSHRQLLVGSSGPAVDHGQRTGRSKEKVKRQRSKSKKQKAKADHGKRTDTERNGLPGGMSEGAQIVRRFVRSFSVLFPWSAFDLLNFGFCSFVLDLCCLFPTFLAWSSVVVFVAALKMMSFVTPKTTVSALAARAFRGSSRSGVIRRGRWHPPLPAP
jgi:hypothetical protein